MGGLSMNLQHKKRIPPFDVMCGKTGVAVGKNFGEMLILAGECGNIRLSIVKQIS